MKALKLLLIFVVAAGVIAWMTRGYDVSPASVLPFCGGRPLNLLYELAGLVMIVSTLAAARRLLHHS